MITALVVAAAVVWYAGAAVYIRNDCEGNYFSPVDRFVQWLCSPVCILVVVAATPILVLGAIVVVIALPFWGLWAVLYWFADLAGRRLLTLPPLEKTDNPAPGSESCPAA